MLINAFDLETSSGNRSIELRVGEFKDLGIDVDLLGVETQANPRGFLLLDHSWIMCNKAMACIWIKSIELLISMAAW